MMQAARVKGEVHFTLNRDEAVVLFEMLQRLVEENETKLLPLLHSSAEFAVLCRINNHLEKQLPEALTDHYEELLKKARAFLVRESGSYIGIEEKT